MIDPASEGHHDAFEWTKADVDGVTEELGRRAVSGRFNPSTWTGDPFGYDFADGKTRAILPRYFKLVAKQWRDTQPEAGK